MQRRGIAVLVDRHQRAPVAILAHDVGLRRKAVADMRNIAHVKRGTVDGLNRQVIQLRDGLRRSVHLDVVFQRADFYGAAGQDQVLRVNGIDNVIGREPIGLELRQIQIDLDLGKSCRHKDKAWLLLVRSPESYAGSSDPDRTVAARPTSYCSARVG